METNSNMTSPSKSGPPADKIRSMFGKVATGYDRANNLLSGGIHHLWRKQLVKSSGAKSGFSVLDCATGTGDLAIEFKKVVGSTGRVIGTDFCKEMLQFAPIKAQQKKLEIDFQLADVMSLPFADNQFDICSISFGIRNVEDPLQALKEMSRVTKPGGKILVLEFGRVETPIIGPLFNWYSNTILPSLGGWITGQKQAYQYLQTSSAAFPTKKEFLQLMDQTGHLENSTYRMLSGGIAYLYEGTITK